MSFRNIAILFIFNIIYYINSQTTDGQKEENSQFTNTKRDVIPSIYVRGSHYEIGYSIGFYFRHIIQDFLNKYEPLKRFEEAYETEQGEQHYNECYNVTDLYFSQYILELKGIARGADVEFKKLFLIHMDEIIMENPNKANETYKDNFENSTVMANIEEGLFMGQNVNVSKETNNHYYIVNAHIIPAKNEGNGKFKKREEKWTSLTYAGMLSGYMGGYNYHGLVYTINQRFPKKIDARGIPQVFLTRALLASLAEEHEIEEILLSYDKGTADPFIVNYGIFNPKSEDRSLYMAEVTSMYGIPMSRCKFTRYTTSKNPFFYTNNLIQTLNSINKQTTEDSDDIKNLFDALTFDKSIMSLNDIKRTLGATINKTYQIYKDKKIDSFNTMISGIFNFHNMTWTIWTKNPYINPPSLVLSLNFKNFFGPTSKKN